MAQWFTFRNKFTGFPYAFFATAPSELPFHSFTADQNPFNGQLELSEAQQKCSWLNVRRHRREIVYHYLIYPTKVETF